MKTPALLLVLFLPVAAQAAPDLSREDFNRLAAQAGLPFFWQASSGAFSPEGLAPVGAGSDLSRFVKGGRFTAEFDRAHRRLVEARRLEAVRRELDQGRPVLVASDFRQSPAADRALVERVAAAAKLIEELYLRQKGAARYRDALLPGDAASRALFERNQGPWCEAPATENDPFCSAVPSFPPRLSGAYPEGRPQDEAFCESLRALPDAKALLDPFTVVREQGGRLAAVPLQEAYGPTMRKVAAELRAAASAQGPEEAALKAYLLGAARGFETGDWSEADEAWSKMGARNSRWYLRIAPDETGFEPCQEKAGFHVSFARVDTASLAWQDRLAPLRQEMEDSLAALIGRSYRARAVSFSFPDFIEVVLNAGDSRSGLGAITGQSLPNWGKVAEEGRRRTVAMTNLYEDPDSKRAAREKAAQLLSPETMAYYPEGREPGLVGVILHEAAHNLGPHTDYRVGGRNPSEIFGGRLDGVLEELKAQTAALWYVELLRRKGLVSERGVREIVTHELAWCFGHIMQGMTEGTGAPKPYSQLSAVQVGFLAKSGALVFGGSPGRFSIDFERLPAAVESLMREVGRVKAEGDAAGAKALVEDFVSGPDAQYVHAAEIRERLLRFPKESFVYSVLY